jgi:hypothetical protein
VVWHSARPFQSMDLDTQEVYSGFGTRSSGCRIRLRIGPQERHRMPVSRLRFHTCMSESANQLNPHLFLSHTLPQTCLISAKKCPCSLEVRTGTHSSIQVFFIISMHVAGDFVFENMCSWMVGGLLSLRRWVW